MSNKDPHEDPEPSVEPQADTGRRQFLRTTVAAAVGVGVVGALGESTAAAANAPAGAITNFTFDSRIVPAALTPANIKKITDAVAAKLAQEAKSGLEAVTTSFHVRLGGGHSRVFSKTAGHKNVGHSEVIIDGSLP